MTGYYGEVDDSPIDESGWLHTGDLGRIDADGYLFITGRCKDLIIRGGENIAPAAVERALIAVAGVAEAVVFGLPHAVLGEEVAAVVVVEGDLTPETIQADLRSRLASFAAPSRWWLRKEPLPVNHTGKIDKPAVVAQVQAEIRAELAKAGENR
jgi:acyl-CoA synthetase (AMP-forming)/AMP-acid ligase II